VKDFAKSNGLTVTLTHPNRVVLDVEATVTDVQKAFHLRLHTYRHPREAREFYAPDVEPSLRTAIAAEVALLRGLLKSNAAS